ncbi:MAG: hypothetical protein AAF657_18270, partial [Acidobacteriota bacterium]
MNLGIPAGAALCILAAGLTFTAASAWAARLFPQRSHTEHLARTLLVAQLCMVWPVALLGFAGGLTTSALAAVLGLLLVGSLHGSKAAKFKRNPRPSMPRALRWPVIGTAVLVVLDLCAYLPAPPIDWDAMTYHLYLPARWLQEGRIFHVPTVFSDNAAAFAPQNGALFFAWQMALSGRDAVVNVSQLVCLALLGLALYRACRVLGADRRAAALAALTLPWLEPIRRWTFSANVDVFLHTFAFAALTWQLLYLRRPERPTAVLAGLASGLAMGTKALGLPLIALQSIPLCCTALRRRRPVDLVLFVVSSTAAGGWWYLRNAWHYGNPLFPIQVSLGPIELPGAYGTEALRAGEFHLEGLRAVADSVRGQWGLTTCLLMILGLVALGRRVRRDLFRRRSFARRQRTRHLSLLPFSLALAWAVFFVHAVPHNNQARFALPILLVSLIGWGLVLHQAGRQSREMLGIVWFIGIAMATFASKPWADWRASFVTLEQAGVGAHNWLLVTIVCGAATTAVVAWRSRLDRRLSPLIIGLLAWAVLTLATLHADTSRAAFLAKADYRGWAEGYLAFNHPESPFGRIAYSGANIPYALAGPGWRNRVVYVNTQGQEGDGFYEFWARDRRSYPYHKPGLYRGQDDVDLWLERLENQRIDTVVLFRLHRAEQQYIRSTPGGFPIEQAWVRQFPAHFEPVVTGPVAEIWRFL